MTKNDADIVSLRTAMNSNTAGLTTALAYASVDVSTVVAADIGNDGILTVYIR